MSVAGPALWATWAIAAAATAGIVIRPFAWPEFVWAAGGALLLVATGLLPVADALNGVWSGADVYLFLLGMMLLAELARQEGLFDWLAARAGLFVQVRALERTGVTEALGHALHGLVQHAASAAAWAAGMLLAVGCNLVNNLPAGLLAGRVAALTPVPEPVRRAMLIGVDLGPNLSVTGSLATILWLAALRREGHTVGAWAFLKLGALVMPPALVLALAGAAAFN